MGSCRHPKEFTRSQPPDRICCCQPHRPVAITISDQGLRAKGLPPPFLLYFYVNISHSKVIQPLLVLSIPARMQIPSSTVVAVDPLKIGIGTRGREPRLNQEIFQFFHSFFYVRFFQFKTYSPPTGSITTQPYG
jgi:hypothetical protein